MADKTWLIHGDGLAAWATAALLARALPADHAVAVVGAPDGSAQDGFDAVAAEPDGMLVRLADGAENALLAQGQAGFCLGSIWRGWRDGADVAVARQEPLPPIQDIAVPDLVLRALHQTPSGHSYADLLAPLQFQARAMAAGAYAHPSPDRQSPRSLLRPLILLDSRALSARLQATAQAAGVDRISQAEAERLSPFMVVEARPNLFDDDEDWRVRLGHDRRLTIRCCPRGDLPAYIERAALPQGLAMRAALPQVDVFSLDYDQAATTPQEARAALTSWIGEAEVFEERDAPAAPRRRAAPWRENGLALGRAAACFDPDLDGVCLDAQLGVLAGHLPCNADQIPACALAYNQAVALDLGHRADRLHLIRLQGPGGDALAGPGADLERRIALFQSRNRSVALDGDPYDAQHWILLMASLGLTPRRHDVQADRLDLSAAMGAIGRMVMAFDQTLAALPSHKDVFSRLRRPD